MQNRIQFFIPLFFTIVFLFFTNCKDPVEEKCTQACGFFVSCTEKAQKMKIEGELLKQATIQCIDGCTRFQSQILSCYDAESNSCNGMAECMKQSGLDE
ncbi:MAG TPA: Cys-rich protein [Leptospiraceae bacterium]|nr:Cys-rich protein [Leptospiraceae bacterium]HMW05225.1 Cys-rich protein [Leptospiraceae bacterium]HMX31310.1 Cys-rich protein [Leptospiraceae bacterium]HMY32116.1 Cys-rich protein [Leptospiraceae bacterium]HMZ64667.1 Cys-rich protein [Leptospiraceae bacterium]